MRALTWKQPFASLMLQGKIETRTWQTEWRGSVLICAGKSTYTHKDLMDLSGLAQYERICERFGTAYKLSTPHGVAIAVGKLVDCRPMTKEDENACFVAYNPKLWCHVYENVRPIEPIPYKGRQGWSWVPTDIEIELTALNP